MTVQEHLTILAVGANFAGLIYGVDEARIQTWRQKLSTLVHSSLFRAVVKKITWGTLFVVSAFFVFATREASAAIVTVDKDGEVVWNILSSNQEIALTVPRPSSIEITEVVNEDVRSSDARLFLSKEDDKVNLKLIEGGQQRELDVTHISEDIIEIEERGETSKVVIGISGDQFTISQNNVTAKTNYPISVDPQNAEISVKTPSGFKYISILPADAVVSSLRSKVISVLRTDNPLTLTEKEGGQLLYVISGEKNINVIEMIKFAVPVTAEVSASTGEIVFVEQPTWLKVLGFLFV